MRAGRIRRVLTAAVAVVAAASTAVWSPGAATAASGPAVGPGFDPTHAYAIGSTEPLHSQAAPAVPPGANSPATPTDPNGGSLALGVDASVETAQGTPLTDTLPGGDSLQVYGLGVVSRVHPDGSTVWQRGTGSLYRDWHLTFSAGGYVATPQLVVGTDPVDPYVVTTAEPYAMRNTRPYAIGDLTGDGSTDIAVAETVGVNLGAAGCGNCGWPFTVPGSDLHLGTFVTVLDGRTGATLYDELDPGFVTQLAVAGRHLVIGDVTGSPTSPNGPGAWGSFSTVRALSLHRAHSGLTATQAWRYSTGAQWGLLLGMQPIGDSVAVSWSDTPLGLGVPGPPDGHVVLVDGRGHVRWDQRTAGYPVLTRYDPSRGQLAVVEQSDPTQAVRYTLAGLRVGDGRTVTASTVTDVVPTALTIGALAPHSRPSWVVAGVVTTPDLVQPPYYGDTAATVVATDPDSARTTWSRTFTAPSNDSAQPGSVAVVPAAHGPATVVVGSSLGTVLPTPSSAATVLADLRGLSGTSGTTVWDHEGDVPDPLSLAVAGDGVRGVTAEQDAVTYDAADGRSAGSAPLFGALYAVVATGGGYAVGGLSGAVYAVDAAALTPADDAPHVTWRADVGGPVRRIVSATVDGRPVLAVAATNGLVLLDQRTGQVLHRMPLPGQYAWNVAVGDVGGRTVVVSGTDRVTAFDATTGAALWTYQPSGGVYFANPSIVDGIVVTEYQNQVATDQAASSMAAVGIDAATGQPAWTAPADPATTRTAQLRDGVAAGPGIAGAGSDGAAFTWTTTDWQGRVDVRDARTGALLYSDTSDELAGHESYTLDAGVGLVSTGHNGTALINPGGPTASPWIQASSVAVVRSAGTPVLVTAEAGVAAYPVSALSEGDNPVDPLAEDTTFLPATVYVTPDQKVLTLPIDWTTHEVLSVETGENARPYLVSVQQGLAVLRTTGSPAAAAAEHRAMTPNAPVSRPTTVPVGSSGAGIGTAQPAAQILVHGYDATGKPQLAESDPSGYDPATMRAYLGLHGTGAGQTVAVVDAYGDPNIVADVNRFSTQFGLQQVCADGADSGCFRFTVTAPEGTGTANSGWGLETAMDVEWIHAVAPQAAVVLVEAADGGFAPLFHAVDVAAALHPDAISMSWGLPEEFTDETYYDHHCQLTASVCVVSTGDYGHPGSYPAYNPSVLAIGGTTLDLAGDGTVTGETAWSGSGGGLSYVEPTPAYQRHQVTGGRGIPDVGFDADPATGVAVYDTFAYGAQTGWFQVGGTSLGAPSWAAIVASADQLRTAAGKARLTSANGSAQRAVYGIAGQLGDIVAGPSNGFCPDICSAGPGYDFVTGLGSPRVGVDATLSATP